MDVVRQVFTSSQWCYLQISPSCHNDDDRPNAIPIHKKNSEDWLTSSLVNRICLLICLICQELLIPGLNGSTFPCYSYTHDLHPKGEGGVVASVYYCIPEHNREIFFLVWHIFSKAAFEQHALWGVTYIHKTEFIDKHLRESSLQNLSLIKVFNGLRHL